VDVHHAALVRTTPGTPRRPLRTTATTFSTLSLVGALKVARVLFDRLDP
jgi:hypothetical protein